jgi:hypothetical protein
MYALAFAVALMAQNPAPQEPAGRRAAADAKTAREQAVFKEWARGVRKSIEAAEKLKGKKPAERTARAVRSAMAKEDKIRAKYRLGAVPAVSVLA